MIKKILVISILSISFLFASNLIQQKRAEAEIIEGVGEVLYIAAATAVNFAIGAYTYFTGSDGNTKVQEVTDYDNELAKLTISITEVTDTADGINATSTNVVAYPEAMLSLNETMPTGIQFVGNYYLYKNQGYSTLTSALDAACTYYPGIAYCNYFDVGDKWRIGRWVDSTGAGGANGGGLDTPILNSQYSDFEDNQYDYIIPEEGSSNLGASFSGDVDGVSVTFYEYEEDTPDYESCSDGIQNQDETGIDCGGVCDSCPVPETCNDGIMNQDETGIDYGGLCGTGDPVAAPAQNFTDTNQDGVDDLSGLDATGSITVASPGEADGSTYDSSLPGDISEVGETDWSGLITGYLATNPLVLLATGSSISLSGEDCTLTANVFNSDIVLDFCSVEGMVDLIGTFVLGLMTIRSVFIAMGI
jgi:hypothetical protein